MPINQSNVALPGAHETLIPADSRASRPRRKAWRDHQTLIVGVVILTALLSVALFAGLLFPEDPMAMVGPPMLWPLDDAKHLLGTDALGRDVAAGIVHGARASLLVALSATLIGLSVGVLVGATAGYFNGMVDDVLVRIIEIFQTIPPFILLIVLVAIASPSIATIAIAIGIVKWAPVARLVRAEFRSWREKEFVIAARCQGYGHMRIIFREILPNALPSIVVFSSVMVASAVLMESSLSFMGMGDPNVISWGSMIGAGRDSLRTAWYLTAVPGFAIVLLVFSVSLIGDGLNNLLNPKTSPEY